MLAILRHQGIDAKLVLTDTQKIIDWKDELSLYRKEVIDLISTLQLQNSIEFRPIQYSMMPTLYEEADIVIYPTVGDEPYGLVPLEAMSARRPIIASASGGITETVVDRQTGFLFSRGNVMELTNHVSNLLQHPDLARRIGAAGRSHVSSHFDIRHYVSTLLANYQT
jgi:glycosyltransferase involved in cell wall biosynthesis